MLQHGLQNLSFSWLNNILLYVYTTLCLSIHPLVNTCIIYTFWLLWITLLWTWACMCLFKIFLSVVYAMYMKSRFLTSAQSTQWRQGEQWSCLNEACLTGTGHVASGVKGHRWPTYCVTQSGENNKFRFRLCSWDAHRVQKSSQPC